jgi:tyrosyl-tRNA synthetase
MSKSLGNYIGVTDAPGEMFGKVMSISDELMWRYYLLLTDESEAAVAARRAAVAAGTVHPKDAKVELARRIVTDFHSAGEAAKAAADFDARFARGELVADALAEVAVVVPEAGLGLAKIVVQAGLASSSSEAVRKIQQGGVRVERVRVTDGKARVQSSQLPVTLEVGRRAVRVVLADAPGA